MSTPDDAHEGAALDDALNLYATPETAEFARALGRGFCGEHPKVRLRLSTCATGDALRELDAHRTQAVIVPRVLTPDEARSFAAKGFSLTQFPLRLDPYAGPHQPRPGELPRTALLYAFDETVRGRPVVRAFSVYARCNAAAVAHPRAQALPPPLPSPPLP